MRLCIAFVLLFSGCGARSGLELIPSVPVDAGVRRDAPSRDTFSPFDVPPECVGDGECHDGASCTDDVCLDGRCVREAHDERCDDGLFCDGREICRPGTGTPSTGCVSGVPVVCTDAITCTEELCDEALDACVSVPRVERCPLSHRCDPRLGCVARALAHDATFLYEIDLPTGALATLGALPVGLTDLALHPDGTLYGAADALYAVDYVAGTFTRIADVGGGAFNALDVSPEGTLFGAASSRVVRFDVAAGTTIDVARFPMGLFSSGDIAFVDGVLYATTSSDPGGMFRPDQLVEVDVRTGRSRTVGSVGHPCVWGLAPFGSTLYGLTCEGLLLRIDVGTGAGTVLASQPPSFYGAGAR